MRQSLVATLAATLTFVLLGCNSQVAEGPPEIRLGDSVCDECNMIISDKRWATATIVEGPRGPTPLLFDDFNCQVRYETEHSNLVILDRWSYCHATGSPIQTGDASFVESPNLRTPMGSGIAAFASSDDANAARVELTGVVLSFNGAWSRFRPDTINTDNDEQSDGPEGRD